MPLFLDLETYSDVDLKRATVYKYAASNEFKILLLGYAIDGGPVCTLDWQAAPEAHRREIVRILSSADRIVAHNAQFERVCLAAAGLKIPSNKFICSSVLSAANGLPSSLAEACEALDLANLKDPKGKALIKLFCTPRRVKKTETLEIFKGRDSRRNLPSSHPEKWAEFINYLTADVEATRALFNRLVINGPLFPSYDYNLDQKINDKGIYIDSDLVREAIELDQKTTEKLKDELRRIAGGINPNSGPQLINFIVNATGIKINNLRAETVAKLIDEVADYSVRRVLTIRQRLSLASVAKYKAAAEVTEQDSRARGLLKFFGAGRTGRWAGAKIQVQNMPRNSIKTLALARELVRSGDFETLSILYDDPQYILKQLLRTMLIAPPGHSFVISDFSAIEARVIAWLANEEWRLRVFESHGKIYEASAAAMFNVPFESVTKGSAYRAKGKIAELALGYQGALGALKQMGGEKMGLSENEMRMIVKRWRNANRAIVQLWADVESAAVHAVETGKQTDIDKLSFRFVSGSLHIDLPSGRPIVYQGTQMVSGSLTYMGAEQQTRKWARLDTYGGKLVENIVQAIARDLLVECLRTADKSGFNIVMHVHDEIVAEEPDETAGAKLAELNNLMARPIPWAPGLTLAGDGFLTKFYIKD